MADTQIPGLPAITGAPNTDDTFVVREAESNTDRKVTMQQLLDAFAIDDSNALVNSDFDNASQGIMVKTGMDAYETKLYNLTASSAPTASDDSSVGYSVMSMWYDLTNDVAYTCLDPTVDNAVWVRIGTAGDIVVGGNDITGVSDILGPTGVNLTVAAGTDSSAGGTGGHLILEPGEGETNTALDNGRIGIGETKAYLIQIGNGSTLTSYRSDIDLIGRSYGGLVSLNFNSSITIDLSKGNKFSVAALTGDIDVTIDNGIDGQYFEIVLEQDGDGTDQTVTSWTAGTDVSSIYKPVGESLTPFGGNGAITSYAGVCEDDGAGSVRVRLNKATDSGWETV